MRAFGAIVLVVCAACAQPRTPADEAGDAGRVRAFEAAEDEILRDLAALDRRLARRARIEPREEDLRRIAMAGILADDPTLAVVEGAIDPFSFDARGRALAVAKRKIAALPAKLPDTAEGTLPSPALERELLARLVDEEVLRLEEERALPRSASALVRAVVDTWSAPRSADEVPARDRWLARRLGEVRIALEKGSLDVVRARELDDALDALEHSIDAPGYTHATQELLHVREALEAQGSRKGADAASEWPEFLRRLRAHLGVATSPEEIDAELERAQRRAADRAKEGTAAAHVGRDELAKAAAPHLFPEGDCIDAVPGSRVRSMAASLERNWSCHIRHGLRGAKTEAELAPLFVSLHDHVVVARWALDVARGASTIAQATARTHLFTPPGVDVQARLERIALARPVAALGAGLTAAMLLAGSDPGARARLLAGVGEVPLDVAAHELERSTSVRPAPPL